MTNYEKLFGTPEKAAWTLANACAKCNDKFPCWECPLHEISGSNVYEPELLDWLTGTARTDNRTTELLPCPFCGGYAHVESVAPETSLSEGELAAWVICDVCRAQIERKWEGEAIEAWNRRAE